jgi:hypothetical protein
LALFSLNGGASQELHTSPTCKSMAVVKLPKVKFC